MKYWWVNQNQTFKQEIQGGYLWSPKTKRNGARNTFYDNMTRVNPGDIVFSFFKSKISVIGVIKSHGYSQSKPDFGSAGSAWDTDGWKVDVEYHDVHRAIKPKRYIDVLKPLLPSKYSPLRDTGDGVQVVYLAELPSSMGELLLELVGEKKRSALDDTSKGSIIPESEIELDADLIEEKIKNDPSITETEKTSIITARLGQGRFREEVLKLHQSCPFTGISNPILLRAGHIKPWAKCETNQERTDPLNGLALSPAADHLFDKGYLSFSNEGKAIFSSFIDHEDLIKLGLLQDHDEYKIRILNEKQRIYLQFHRNSVFKTK